MKYMEIIVGDSVKHHHLQNLKPEYQLLLEIFVEHQESPSELFVTFSRKTIQHVRINSDKCVKDENSSFHENLLRVI